jgi:uncharacterized coiled-coil protein SlyX
MASNGDNNDIGARLVQLESHADRTEIRIGKVEQALTEHSHKLDRLLQVVTQQSAQPRYDPQQIVSFVRDVVVVGGAIASIIIYIATNIMQNPVQLLDYRISQLEHATTTTTVAKAVR